MTIPPGDRAALGVAFLLPAAALLDQLVSEGRAAGIVRLAFAILGPGLLGLRVFGLSSRGEPLRAGLHALALSPLILAVAALALRPAFSGDLVRASHGAAWLLAAGLVSVAVLRPVPRPERALPARRDGRVPRAWASWAVIGAALVLFAAVLWPAGARLSYHGLLHAGFVAQIAGGLVPPENPALAGEPLGFYWLFHWLLAVHGALSGLSVLVTGPLLNGVSLLLYLGASHLLLARFLHGPLLAVAVLAAGFAGNWLFPVVWAGRAVVEGMPHGMDAFWPFQMLSLGSLGGDPRLVTLFAKFLNQGGFALGLGLWAVLIEELAPGDDDPSWRAVFLFLCSLVALHTTTALAAFAALAPAIAAGAIGSGRSTSRLVRGALTFAAAALATAPYLWSITIGAHSNPGVLPPVASQLRYSLLGVAGSATPLLVVAALAGIWAWRTELERFLWVATTLLVLAGFLVSLPDGNQYKLTLLAAFPGGVLLLSRWRARAPLLLLIAGFALAGHLLTASAYMRSVMSARENFVGDGAYLAVSDDADLDRALRWIRSETQPDAVVVSRVVRFGASAVRPATGRSEFVLRGGHHTTGNPIAERRILLVKRLFASDADPTPALRAIADEIDRPLYLLLSRRDFADAFEGLAAKFDARPELLTPRLRSADAVVYRLERE